MSNVGQLAGGCLSNLIHVGPTEEVHADSRDLFQGRMVDHLVGEVDAQYRFKKGGACKLCATHPLPTLW